MNHRNDNRAQGENARCCGAGMNGLYDYFSMQPETELK